MRDSRTPLHVLDLLDAPELWPEARRRAEEVSVTGRPRAVDTSLGPPRRRLLVGVVAFAIAAAGIGLAVASFLGPGGSAGGAGDQAQIVLSARAPTWDAQLVATSEIVQARLNAADIASSVSVQDGTIVVSLPNESIQGESRADTLQLVSASGLFELREVLTVYSPGSPEYDSIQLTCAPGDATCEDDAVQSGPAVFMDEQGNKYELGPIRLSNGDIERVEAVSNTQAPAVSGDWSVEIGLTPTGADKLANLTSGLVGKQLAFVLDQQVLSAPTVQSPIDGGSVQVAGQFTEGQAKTLAEILSAPPLPVALTIIDIVQPSPAVVEPSPTAVEVIVPVVVGLDGEQASSLLENAGLTVVVTSEPSNDVPEGVVASQDPAAGTAVDSGSSVTVVLSEGPRVPPSGRATAPYARYYFITPTDTGVLEVWARPATVCYSTQSDPARPIVLIAKLNGMSRRVASYEPPRVQYCDRAVREGVAAALISDPSSFVIKWSPQAGAPVVMTPLTPTSSA